MLQTIVVAVNDLKRSEEAVAHAAILAQPFSARVLIAGIIEQISGLVGEKFTDPVIWSMKKSEAQALLNQQVHHLEEQGVETRLDIIEASTVESLLQYAQEVESDLLVVAYDPETSAPMIRSILKHSKTPVFLTRPGWAKPTYSNILVPLDGSQRAESSLTLATTIAKAMNAQLHIAHAVPQIEMARQSILSSEVSEIAQQLVERSADEANRYLEQVASRQSIETQTHVIVNGSVTTSLHNMILSENIDLLILSAHGYSGEPQWPFGTVAENIVNYSKVPTILVQDLPAYFSKSEQPEPTRILNGTYS
jgi:nucleotide-binding universal stress UspA family protein